MSSVALRTRNAKSVTSAKARWLLDRQSYLGATDVAAIHGINPYSSAHDVWLSKRGLKEDESNLAMRAGTYMESFIAAEYQRETGIKILRSQTYRHEKFPFLACNPDREMVYRKDGKSIPAILECKNVGAWAARNFGQDGSDQIPEHYLMQVMWQLLITGKELVVLAALIDDRKLATYYYTFNPEYSGWAHVFDRDTARAAFSYAIHWWNRHIVDGIEPDLDGSAADEQFVKRERATYENGQLTNADEETDRECVRLGPALRRKARAEFAVNERKNRIKQFMAREGASSLESTVGLFTWKTNVKGVAVFQTPYKTEKA